jgi:hypothetical protein
MMTKRTTGWALCLRILCAVGLLFVAFAHRPAVAAGPGPAELAAYVLPDGSMADLCINDTVDNKIKPAPGAKCEACRIAGATLLPAPTDLAGTVLTVRRLALLPPMEEALPSRRERPGAPPRAPPFVAA